MRMWMVKTKWLCRKHLLGEHVETHMFVGTINSGRSLDGYIERNLVEPAMLRQRHDALAREMEARGYKHNSPLPEINKEHWHEAWDGIVVRVEDSLYELIQRCDDCAIRCSKDL